MRAWALAIVSAESQAETLEHQEAWACEVAKERGWTLERVVSGVSSGRTGPRRLLTELIGDLRDLEPVARPQWLLLIRADRIGRGRIVDSQVALHAIADLGVRIWTRDAGEFKLDSATDQIIAAVKAGLATLENEVRRDKAVAVYRRKRAAGMAVGNKRAYGLAIGPDGKDVALEPQAEAVRLAFRLRCEGLGYWVIANRLAPMAAPYPYRTGERPVRWTPVRIRKMLRNRAYVGTVVDEVTFARAAMVAERSARELAPARRRHPWPLSGALRCYCGARLIGSASGQGKRTRYYVCRSTWNHDGRQRLVSAPKMESRFAGLLEQLAATPALIDRYRRRASTVSPVVLDRAIDRARTELAEVNRKRTAIWAAFEGGQIRGEDVQERLDAFVARRDELTATIADLTSQRAVAAAASGRDQGATDVILESARLYPKATVERQQTVARLVALHLGGLCVEETGELAIRTPTDPGRQRRTNPL